MLIIILKIFHFACLIVGGASTIGGAVLRRRVAASGKPPEPLVAETLNIFGRMGLAAVVLLWITGVAMVLAGPGFAAMNWAFWIKILGATGLLLALPYMRQLAATGADWPEIEKVARIARLALIVALIFAVISFT